MISPLIGPRDQLLDLLPCENFDLSMGYRQVKSEPTMFVMLSYLQLSLEHTPLYLWSDQYYHIVHLTMEFLLYGNLDELLLSPSAASCLLLDSC